MSDYDRNRGQHLRYKNRHDNIPRYYPRERIDQSPRSNLDYVEEDVRRDMSYDPNWPQNWTEPRQRNRQGSRGQPHRGGRRPNDYEEGQVVRDQDQNWQNDPYYSRYEYGKIYDWDDRYNENWDYNNWMGPYYGVGPEGYHRPDNRIWEDVNERLTEHGQLDPTDINVLVDDGVVTLQGTVQNRQEKRLAEQVADHVLGVQDVINQLKIGNK